MTLPKLFFFHNPKAAGTSLLKAIELAKGDEQSICAFKETIETYESINGEYGPFSGHDVYIGHYDRYLYNAVNSGHIYITNFRHPVGRCLSLYNYFNYVVKGENFVTHPVSPDRYAVEAATRMSFHDFICSDHPYIRIHTSDHHFRQLTASQWSMEEPEATVEDACAFIDGALCYYVCEYKNLSMRYISAHLDLASIPYYNKSHDKPDSLPLAAVDRATYDAILEINQRDMAIYHHAVERLHTWDVESRAVSPRSALGMRFA